MGLKAGIVGLPNVGKSTLFNAITNSNVEAANYPFATIEPNKGVVELNDIRIDNIAKIVKPQRVLKATFEFIDIAGIVEGASKGEGLGNKFLSNIREVDAIIQVVRCFDDPNISHVAGKIDPIYDTEIINSELLLADFETIEKVLLRVSRKALQTKDKDLMKEHLLATKIKEFFEKEIPAREIEFTDEEAKVVKGWNLLTLKPMIYVGNVDEAFVASPNDAPLYKKLETVVGESNIVGISAKIEGEISVLDDEGKEMFIAELGITESGLDKITRSSFDTLGLATYFTAGVKEVRAWTFDVGMKAPQCAGVIHTDFERGFIKADVVSYKDYIECGGELGAREKGKYRLEGKDYVFQDGDITEFKFNV